jgi:glycosyl transferase family 25
MQLSELPHFFFDKSNTFCISLEGSLRWNSMQIRLQKSGLDATYWKASTHNDLTDQFIYYLNNGQKGCAQSHLNIYKHMISNNLLYALILEDDACFDMEWKEKLAKINEEVKDNNWDAIFLNASETINPLNKWVSVTEQYMTAGYIISLNGAKKIINQFKGCYYASDWMTTRLQLQGHCYSYFPWLIIQEGKDSSIGNQEHYEADYKKVIRCLSDHQYSLDNYILE